MKVIIAGSRKIVDYEILKKAIQESGFEITQIISGGAKGADNLGERYAREMNIPCRVMTANWDFYGLQAGYLRNEDMAKAGEALIALWDGKSKGTRNMISIAKRHGLKIYVKELKEAGDINELPLFKDDKNEEKSK